MTALLYTIAILFGSGLVLGLVLWGLDWLAGWLHRRRTRRRSLWR